MFSLASSFMFSLASSLAFSPGTFGVRPYVNNQPVNQISPVSVTARERAQVIFTFGLALFCWFARERAQVIFTFGLALFVGLQPCFTICLKMTS
jgi:hypothetical protein